MKLDDDFEFYPYYKERKMDGKTDVCSVRLPKETKKEIDSLLESQYGSTSEGLKHILIEYLNSNCLERKYFNFEMIFITNKTVGHFNFNDLNPIGYYDHYSRINQLKHEGHIIPQKKEYIPQKKKYLKHDSLRSLQNFEINFNYLKEYWNDFTSWNPDEIDYFSHLEKKFGNLKEYRKLSISLNNFLDKKINGTYMDSKQRKKTLHRGLGLFRDENKNIHFYSYLWRLNPYQIEGKWMIDFDYLIIDHKDKWIELIYDSTNNDLKRFLHEIDLKLDEIDKDNAILTIEFLEDKLSMMKKELNNSNKNITNEMKKKIEKLEYLRL